MKRLEFTKAQKLEMFKRAGGPENLRCEGCSLPLRGKKFEYDHSLECWEKPDRKDLSADDGRVLGADCCHRPKTSAKATQRAHGDRLIASAARAKTRKGQPLMGTKASGWKKPFYAPAHRREEV